MPLSVGSASICRIACSGTFLPGPTLIGLLTSRILCYQLLYYGVHLPRNANKFADPNAAGGYGIQQDLLKITAHSTTPGVGGAIRSAQLEVQTTPKP